MAAVRAHRASRAPGGLNIEPAGPSTWPALEALFREGGDPRWCWCQYWRLGSKEFSSRRVPALRDGLRALVDGPLSPGLVALDGDRAIGWVSLGPRGDFDRLTRSRTIPRLGGDDVWSIVCFAVSRSARGRGVTARLLDAAVEYARSHGARTLEAYPVDVGPGGSLAASQAYTGTPRMFERAGFELVADTTSTAGGHPRVLVRRSLAR